MPDALEPGGTEAKLARLEFETRDIEVVDVDTLIGNIKRGTTDGRLDEILDAVAARVEALSGGIRWQIDLESEALHVTEDDLTLGEARLVQALARRPWLRIDPLNDVGCAIAVVTAMLHFRLGLDLVAASARTQKLSATEVAHSISQYTTSGRPFDGGSTPSSTDVSTSSDGLLPSPSSSDSVTSPAS